MFLPSVLVLASAAAVVVAEGCHGDNLLRAMERHNGTAYCSALLEPTAASTVGLPVEVPTTYPAGDLSSACSCLLGVGSTSRAPCHSKTLTGEYAHASSGKKCSSTPTAPAHSDLGGGYSFLPVSPPATCGTAEATTTVQVTETSVRTVYVTSLPSSEDVVGRPAPETSAAAVVTLTRAPSGTESGWVSTVTLVGTPGVTTITTDGEVFTRTLTPISSPLSVVTVTRDPSGTEPGWTSTITLVGETTSGTTVESVRATPVVTTFTSGGEVVTRTITPSASLDRPRVTYTVVIDGRTTTVTGEVPDTPSTTSSDSLGASSWTLSWLDSSSSPVPSLSTITSDFGGGVVSTWVVTVTGASSVPLTSTTSSTSSSASPSASAGVIVITSVIGGEASTWTVSDGVTLTPTSSSSSATTPSQTVSGGVIVVTSMVSGVASTWTVSDGSTLDGSATPTTTPSQTVSGGVVVVTSVIDGLASTWTVSNGVTLGASNISTASPSPTATPSGGIIVITSVIDGAASTWTISDGSTITPEISTTPTTTASPTPSVIVITSVISGTPSTWTVSGNSTLVPSSTSSTSPSPIATGLVTIITVINGLTSSWTVSDGSTITSPTSSPTATSTPSDGWVVITRTIDGVASTWTVSDGSTLTQPVSSTTSTPTPTEGWVVITRTIDGVASTWTLSDGSTVTQPPSSSATSTPSAGWVVITRTIDGVASTWTVSDGSTLSGVATSTTSSSPTPTGGWVVVTSTINGQASTWTVSDGSTLTSPTGGWVVITRTIDGVASTWTVSNGSTLIGSATSSATSTSATASSTSSAYDSAFTGISIVVSQNATECYKLPHPTESLHESLLDVGNQSAPYIDAFYLDDEDDSVKYVRVVDRSSNPFLLDVSDPSKLAVVDRDGDVLSIDSQGLHFTSADCSPKIDVFISGFFRQIDTLTNSTCARGNSVFTTGGLTPRQEDRAFDVILRLKDQCGDPVRADLPVSVSLGEAPCNVQGRSDPGSFVARCEFPGAGSSPQCETSVEQTLDRLTNGSLVGTCPSFSSTWALLSQQLGNVVNDTALLQPFRDAGLDVGSDLISVIDEYLNLYEFSRSTFIKATSEDGSRMGDMIASYSITSITTQVCSSLQAPSSANLTFTAGTATTPSPLAQFSAVPSPSPEYDRNATDPSALACCPNKSACNLEGSQPFYPPEASVPGTNCLCGIASDGRGIAFGSGSCPEVSQCSETVACPEGQVCLTQNCCGNEPDGDKINVCVNGTECSARLPGRRWLSVFETGGVAGAR